MFQIPHLFRGTFRRRIFRLRQLRCDKLLLMLVCITCFVIFRSQKDYSIMSFEQDELNTYEIYKFPLDVDVIKLVREYRENQGKVTATPINPYHYKFRNNIPDKCKTDDTLSLIFLVKTAASNFNRRSVIRETWGNEQIFKRLHFKTVFVVGKPKKSKTQKLIDNEILTRGDVIQIDFIDAYFNNTLKTTGAIRWVTRYCKNAKFVMIVDDDFYVATDSLIEYLLSLDYSLYDTLFMGKLWDHEIPVRDKSDKWYVSPAEYPYESYPHFVSAGATIMSMKVATDLDIAIQFTKHFRLDDIFLAIVVYKLHIKPIHNSRIVISKDIGIDDEGFNNVLAAHKYGDPDKLRAAWKYHMKNK